MIVSDATHHRVEVGGEGSLRSRENVRVTDNDITREGGSLSLAREKGKMTPKFRA